MAQVMKAEFDFTGQNADELTFFEGDIIHGFDETDGWGNGLHQNSGQFLLPGSCALRHASCALRPSSCAMLGAKKRAIPPHFCAFALRIPSDRRAIAPVYRSIGRFPWELRHTSGSQHAAPASAEKRWDGAEAEFCWNAQEGWCPSHAVHPRIACRHAILG